MKQMKQIYKLFYIQNYFLLNKKHLKKWNKNAVKWI